MRLKPHDEGHRLTERELAELEKRIAGIYKEARDGLRKTIREYFEKFEERDRHQQDLLKAGEITEEQYKQWRLNQIGRGKRYEALRDKIAERYTEANDVAVSYINDETPGIYSLNRNYAAYTIEQEVGNVDFILFDEQTVKRLIVEEPDLMPYYPPKKALKRGIDLEWGKKQITASVTSGILQGYSVGKIADDLQHRMETMNRASALRTARTAVTGAQNAGRQDSYIAAEKMGIKMKREWLATLDNRTRHAHAILDGQRVPVGKPFEVDGYEIMFPGDPTAKAYLVYNCRCTMIAALDDVDTSDALRRDSNGLLADMTFAQWEASKRGYIAGPISKIRDKEIKEWHRENKLTGYQSSGKIGDTDGNSTLVEIRDVVFSDDNAVKKELLKFSQNHANAKVEHSLVISLDGHAYSISGAESFVNTALAGEDAIIGSIIIHNHPVWDGYDCADSFSRSDLLFAAKYKAGIQYLVSGTRKNAFVYTGNANDEELYDAYEKAFNQVRELAFENDEPIEFEQESIMKILDKTLEGFSFYEDV